MLSLIGKMRDKMRDKLRQGLMRASLENPPPVLLRLIAALLVAVLTALLPGHAHAGAPRTLRFEHVGADDGLPQESVNTILQDRTGFMWFGTQAGLARFDGYRNRVFRNDADDPGSLVDNYIEASWEDPQGRLWFGTRGGLVRFDAASQKFVRYPLSTSRERTGRDSAVSAIVGDGGGGLWIGSADGLVHLDPASGRLRTLRRGVPGAGGVRDERVTALARDPQGALWVGRNAGIDRLAPGASRFEHFDLAPVPAPSPARSGPHADTGRNTVLALSIGPRGTLWIGTGAGLEAWRIGEGAPQRRHVGTAEGLGDVRVASLYHDRGGKLWVGTDLDGLKWRDPASGRFVGYSNQPLDAHSLSDNHVSAVWVDRTGTLWVGGNFGGVNRADLASGGFERFSVVLGQRELPAVRKVRAIAADADGRLWLGTTGAGLLHLAPASGRAEQLRHDPARPDSLPDDVVDVVLPARGRLWVGSPTGLAWRDPASGRFTRVALGSEPGASHVQTLMLDHGGRLWIATRGGLFMLDADGRHLRAWHHDALDPASLGDDYGFALLEDHLGAIWIGTENGLDRLDPASGKFSHFRHDPRDPASLRHNRIYDLYESRRGELWVGTPDGLHRMEKRAGGGVGFRLFPVTPGREQLPIGAILEDRKGQLWVSTTVGLTRVDPATGGFKNYTAKDGLIDGTYIVGSAAAGADGELHFGGANGMTSFQPDEIRDNPFPPTVIITDFLVSKRPHSLAGAAGAREVHLSWRDSVFTLEFAALHYADPYANRYAYRLRGFDRDWTDTDASKRFATYTNLDPGSYLFEVRATNKDGVWSRHPATLAIEIAPPFWKTWWFRLLAGLCVLGLVAAAYRLRVRVLVEQKALLERQVGMRTAELVLQKESAEQRKHEAESQKEAVEQARHDIALLSDFGRELTANLDNEAIMAKLYVQVGQLMDATVFAIGLASEAGRLDYPYLMLDGRRAGSAAGCPARVLRLGERCLASGEEILVGDLELDHPRASSEADDDAAALMAVPIMVGARVLGVISVGSQRAGAYQHVQLDMLATLAAYVGVALDNADAYRRLKETQAQLAASEKLASLGSLVAGVAHELNTPIGNSLLMASTLHEKSEALAARLAGNQLKKSELEAWIESDREATGLMMRSLHAAADLVDSFKQVSVDQESSQRRRFDLARACHEIAATMMNRVRRAGHTLELRVAPGIEMDSYPGPLGQVLINFVNNALLHGFDAPGGRMLLSAALQGAGQVRIEFSDDGRGIQPEHLSRIFDPFFTTRMGQGGTGLGLNIAYNIVSTLLQGTIRVESSPGRGTLFVLELPLAAGDAPVQAALVPLAASRAPS